MAEVESAADIEIEVVALMPEQQCLRRLTVPAGTIALEAVRLSGLPEAMPGLVIDAERLGVFSRRVTADHVLQPGDRVEIYRPLTLDPKDARRRRAG